MPRVEVANHAVLVPVLRRIDPFAPALLAASRRARAMTISVTVVVESVEVAVTVIVPATAKRLLGEVVPIPILPEVAIVIRIGPVSTVFDSRFARVGARKLSGNVPSNKTAASLVVTPRRIPLPSVRRAMIEAAVPLATTSILVSGDVVPKPTFPLSLI